MPIPQTAQARLAGPGPALGVPPSAPPEALEIDIDEATGAVRVREPEAAAPRPAGGFDDNLAAALDEAALGALAENLLRGIEADERSRREMLEQEAIGAAASEMDAPSLCQMVIELAEMLRTGAAPAKRRLRPVS